MFTKQSCQHCGTQIEFDADLVGKHGYTSLCPKCQGSVTLLRPPPIAAPQPITTKKSRHLWVVAISVTGFAMLILLLVSVPILSPGYAITPQRYFYQKPLSQPLDEYAFDLALKELNKLFCKSGEFVFANVYREASQHPTFRDEEINRYVQGKRVVYTFGHSGLSEADVMNGWEYRAEVKFFIVGAKRIYNANGGTGWSAWTMSPGDTETENFLYGTTLWLSISKKKGGDWEVKQPDAFIHANTRPLSREKVEELLKLP
jgi:hypothetical protein